MLVRAAWATPLGVLASVLVAWACALLMGEASKTPALSCALETGTYILPFSERRDVARRARWMGNTVRLPADPTGAKRTQQDWRDEVALGRSWLVRWGGLDRDPVLVLSRRRQYAFGFPLVCAWYERSGGLGMFGGSSVVSGGYDIQKALRRPRSGVEAEAALPLRPIWGGLLVNTPVYAMLWIGMVIGVRRVRSALAVRGGCCPKCRYDLSGIPGGAACPECGAPR